MTESATMNNKKSNGIACDAKNLLHDSRIDSDDFDDCLSECVDRNGRVDDINSQSNSKTSRRSRNVSGMHASQFHHNNPFVFKCELNVFQKISTILFSIFVLPCRLFLLFMLLLIAWVFATIGLWGFTMKDICAQPITGWRRFVQVLASWAMRGMFFVGSFHRIKVSGRQVSSKEAPILALAPHSSFFDSIAVVKFGPPAVLAKAETAFLPFFGKLINFTQPIYVWRDDPNSRQNTIKTVIERANSKDNWSQIIIFPEGTCTNRSCLLSFKPGAFYPGVPVQPVCIRYPNALDTVTWTWEGPGALKLLWLTLCQFNTRCEVEFLPVYFPNDEEKNNPKLFATNVRNVMAKALGLPTSDLTYDDCKLMNCARLLNLPHADDIVEIAKLRQTIGLTATNIEENVVTSYLVHDANCIVSMPEFALRLQISIDDKTTADIFRIFDTKGCGTIDFREYLLCALYLIKQNLPPIDLIHIASKMYDDCGKGPRNLTRKALYNVLSHTMAAGVDDTIEIYSQIDTTQKGYITIGELRSFLQSKPDYRHLFQTPPQHKTATKPNPKPKAQ